MTKAVLAFGSNLGDRQETIVAASKRLAEHKKVKLVALSSMYESVAVVLNKVLKFKKRHFFVIEMPNYKLPLLKNVAITVGEKTKSFVFGAGKIILAISIVLWFLGSNGLSDRHHLQWFFERFVKLSFIVNITI